MANIQDMQDIAENANLGYTNQMNKRQKESLIIMSISGAALVVIITMAQFTTF